jgi:hypothetical protein
MVLLDGVNGLPQTACRERLAVDGLHRSMQAAQGQHSHGRSRNNEMAGRRAKSGAIG